MRDTLKIGEFSALGRVSVRMLRHYEKLGLLEPAETDASTGYCHYTLDQLPRLNRIIALKELGFSLQQVGGILVRHPTADEMRTLLDDRRSRAELSADRTRGRAMWPKWSSQHSETRSTDATMLRTLATVRAGSDLSRTSDSSGERTVAWALEAVTCVGLDEAIRVTSHAVARYYCVAA